MWAYAFELALNGLRRFPKSSVLAVLTVALGLAAAMTALTLLHVLAADPLPGLSQHLYSPYVDTVQAKPSDQDGDDLSAADWRGNAMKPADVRALLAPTRSAMQTALSETRADVSIDFSRPPRNQDILLTTHGFAPMFGLPILQGRFWSEHEEQARLAVISSALAERLFASTDPVGKVLHIGKADFQIIGVSAAYSPQPHFYSMNPLWTYLPRRQDDVYLPVQAAVAAGVAPGPAGACDEAARAGTGLLSDITSPRDQQRCEWLIPWVELDTPAQVASYQAFVEHYADDHRSPARYGRQSSSRLDSVAGWLLHNHVIPDNAKLDLWLASAFLLLCMVNVAGLLTARFLRRSQEVSIRRAIGASRRDIFAQHLLESCGACIVGGLLALPLTQLGLWILRKQRGDYNALAHLDMTMFASLLLIAAVVGLLVGLVPAWRATQVMPGLYLKAA